MQLSAETKYAPMVGAAAGCSVSATEPAALVGASAKLNRADRPLYMARLSYAYARGATNVVPSWNWLTET